LDTLIEIEWRFSVSRGYAAIGGRSFKSSKAALKFEVLALELIALSFQRLYTLASHFKNLALAHSADQIVYAIPFVIVSIAVVTLPNFRRRSIKKGFELSIEAVAVMLFDTVMGCSSPALFWSIIGFVTVIFGCSRGAVKLSLTMRCRRSRECHGCRL
jgi:hypothetical protein